MAWAPVLGLKVKIVSYFKVILWHAIVKSAIQVTDQGIFLIDHFSGSNFCILDQIDDELVNAYE